METSYFYQNKYTLTVNYRHKCSVKDFVLYKEGNNILRTKPVTISATKRHNKS